MNTYVERSERKASQGKAYWRSRKQEKQVAKSLSGRTVAQSGAGKQKGDVRVSGRVLIECKCTEKKSFSITKEMLDKIEMAALNNAEVPAIVVEFLGPPARSVAVVPLWVLEQITGD